MDQSQERAKYTTSEKELSVLVPKILEYSKKTLTMDQSLVLVPMFF